jgi:hypothetical protein
VRVTEHEHGVRPEGLDLAVGVRQQATDPVTLAAVQPPGSIGLEAQPGEDIGVHAWVLVLSGRDAPDLVAPVAKRGHHTGELDHLGSGADGDGEPQRRHRHPSKTSLK